VKVAAEHAAQLVWQEVEGVISSEAVPAATEAAYAACALCMLLPAGCQGLIASMRSCCELRLQKRWHAPDYVHVCLCIGICNHSEQPHW
jgi:hypothetical protein